MRKSSGESVLAWLLPPMAAAVGLAAAVAVFLVEACSFRNSVLEWALRDLESRAELAAANLREPLATGDFRAIHAFGDACAADGVRLSVFSGPGGRVYDSVSDPKSAPESIFAVRPCGDFSVRLGLPRDRVMAPYSRARFGFLFAALVGGAGVMLVAVFVFRQRLKLLELSRERDAQEKMLAEMKKVEEFRKTFIADISHEIKTPLTGLLGAADLLASSSELPPDALARLAGMVKKESGRLNSLVQGIVSLARLERGEDAAAVKFTTADLAATIRDTVGRFIVRAEAQGVALTVDSPESYTAEYDESLMESVVENLVSNALRHSGAGKVRVSLSTTKAGAAEITVEDNGSGIAPEHRNRVFDRFHRVDSARSGDTGGSGLGLAIVKRIAEIHGGMISLFAVEPSGCRFVFEFPARRYSAESVSSTDGDLADTTFTESETR
jgi:signal transduction histidine kinase